MALLKNPRNIERRIRKRTFCARLFFLLGIESCFLDTSNIIPWMIGFVMAELLLMVVN